MLEGGGWKRPASADAESHLIKADLREKHIAENLLSKVHMEHLLHEARETHKEVDKILLEWTLLVDTSHKTCKKLIEEHRNSKKHSDLTFPQLLKHDWSDKTLSEDTGSTADHCLKKNSCHSVCMMDRKDCIENICWIDIKESLGREG